MSTEVDWGAALAEIEKKIAKLQATADGIREMIGAGSANTIASERVVNGQQASSGDFLGMSIHDAAKVYLERVRSDKTVRQILEALQEGGLRYATTKAVYTALWRRRPPNGDFVQTTEST